MGGLVGVGIVPNGPAGSDCSLLAEGILQALARAIGSLKEMAG